MTRTLLFCSMAYFVHKQSSCNTNIVILDRGGVGVPQILRYLNPGPIADNCGGILSTGFDPIPKNQDTCVIDGISRSWVCNQ